MSKILVKPFGLLEQNSTSNNRLMCRDLQNANENILNELKSSIIKPHRDDTMNTLVYIISYFFLSVYIYKNRKFPQK